MVTRTRLKLKLHVHCPPALLTVVPELRGVQIPDARSQ